MKNQMTCKNCEFEVSHDYCPNCGQKSSVGKITFSETFQDIISSMFSLDAPLWMTIKTLLLNPGKLFRDFLSGKRKTYYRPVAFFILTTIIFVIVKALLNYDPMENIALVKNGSQDFGLFNKAGVFMAKNINNIIFTFVFSIALMIKMFFYRSYTFAEYLAISFYVVGFYVIITTVSMFILQYFGSNYKMLPFAVMFLYVMYALSSFYQKHNFLTIIKIVFVYFFAILLYIILGYGISLLIVWLKSL